MTQCLYSFPTRPKLRDLSRADDAVAEPFFGDLITADHRVLSENCESRNNQLSTCNRGAGPTHPMDPGTSVQNQNFTRNPEKLAKVSGTREETKSHLH